MDRLWWEIGRAQNEGRLRRREDGVPLSSALPSPPPHRLFSPTREPVHRLVLKGNYVKLRFFKPQNSAPSLKRLGAELTDCDEKVFLKELQKRPEYAYSNHARRGRGSVIQLCLGACLTGIGDGA